MNGQELPSRARQGKPKRGLMIIYWLVLLILASASVILWKMYVPNSSYFVRELDNNGYQIVYRGEIWDELARKEKGQLMLPFSFIEAHISPTIQYEAETDSVIMTTKNKVIHLRTDELTGKMNDKPFQMHFPIRKVDDIIYVPMDPLMDWFGMKADLSDTTGLLSIHIAGEKLVKAEVNPKHTLGERLAGLSNQSAYVRQEAHIHSPIAAEVKQKMTVIVLKQGKVWTRVQTSEGLLGYMETEEMGSRLEELVPSPVDQVAAPLTPIQGKVNLTWEAVYNKNPDTSAIGKMPGLNVVSPTWFHLLDGKGHIENKADKSYVTWAHDRGYQVWALFSNDFDPDKTHEALATHESRMTMIRQLLAFAQLYDLQGFNIDFENVYLEDKNELTQFMRELTPFLHEQGLTVSIDVTVRSNSEMWSLFYDREALAQIVDYMMIMAYDEHWASSPEAGSVASLPWVERHVKLILDKDQVPASKIVLGVPLYTRLWTETQENGKLKVSSKTYSMTQVEEWLSKNKLQPVVDEESGQHYAEINKDGVLEKIWIEDERSLEARLEVVKKYGLAGIATWRRGFEKEEIWQLFQKGLE